jgi:NADH-quinone oxidoreductase subunit H
MVSYEIPMGMALLVPAVTVGSLNLRQIGEAQADGWFSWLAFANPFTFIAMVSYFIASLASCKRAPFDLPEAESELVAGFLTEYSGFRWALFFFAEYAAMFVVAGILVIVFLGGWNSPLPVSWGDWVVAQVGDNWIAHGINGVLFSGPIWFILKATCFLFVQLWVRWTLPRVRIDQVLYACVQVLLPLTMLLLLLATLWAWASTSGSTAWAVWAQIWNIVLGLIGMVFVGGFIAIAAYGTYHRRRLVGNLAVDALVGG